MLDAIRKRSGSIVVKVLLVLLVISFGAWGVGDYVTGGGQDRVVATIGEREILGVDYSEQYRREYMRMRRVFGENLTPDAARSLGMPQNVLSEMIRNEVISIAALDAGLRVDDATVARTIEQMSQFNGLAGSFDRQRFAEVLAQGGFSEQAFVELVRRDVTRNYFLMGLVGTPPVPDALTTRLFRVAGETRDAQMAILPEAALPTPPKPTEAEVAGFYQDNRTSLVAPSFRSVTYVSLDPEAVAEEIDLDEADLMAEYEARAAEFTSTARRDVSQMIVPDEATGLAAIERLRDGEAFADLAVELAGQSTESVALGWIERDDLLPELVEPVFSAEAGELVGPIESLFGWHVFRIENAQNADVTPFEEVRERIEQDLSIDRARERLFDLANAFDEAIGSGASLEDAARDLNLETVTIEGIDRQGRDMSGAFIEDLPTASFVSAIYSEEIGLESPLIETEDGYFAFRVENETEPRQLDLDEVRDRIVRELERQAVSESARALADDIVARIGSGADLAAAINGVLPDAAVDIVTIADVKRNGEGLPDNAPRAVTGAIFDTAEGDATGLPVENTYAIIHVTGIRVPEPSAASVAYGELRDKITAQLEGDLGGQLIGGLANKIGIEVNDAAVDQYVY